MRRLLQAAMAAAICAPSGAALAQDGLCEMKVFDSFAGRTSDEADKSFKAADQFVICFTPTSDGYVTLWDRMPTDGPVERLVPNANFTGDGVAAAKVVGGVQRCFGDGSDGYYLQMDPNDGDGLGRMWLVFSATEDENLDADAYSSFDLFSASYRRFGAGAISSGGEAGGDNDGVCEPKDNLGYDYVVR